MVLLDVVLEAVGVAVEHVAVDVADVAFVLRVEVPRRLLVAQLCGVRRRKRLRAKVSMMMPKKMFSRMTMTMMWNVNVKARPAR